jgi:5'-nucleotidase
MYMH